MEVQERRRRTTLSDQLSAAAAMEMAASSSSKFTTSSPSPNLGDLLGVRQEEDLQRPPQVRSRRSASVSLGTFLACEKGDVSTPGLAAVASAAIRSRTLHDIIRDEDEESGVVGRAYDRVLAGGGDGGHKISWRRAFRERLRIRRAGNPVDGVFAATLILPSHSAASPSGIPVGEDSPLRAGAGDAEPTRTAMAVLPSGGASAAVQAEAADGEEALQQQQQRQVRVSLMALLDETERQGGGPGFAVSALLEGGRGEQEEEEEKEKEEEGGKRQYVKCCVCMVRHKGAAFIPCGHTFCRVCSRELWVSRGSCPLCNGCILEVLDIF